MLLYIARSIFSIDKCYYSSDSTTINSNLNIEKFVKNIFGVVGFDPTYWFTSLPQQRTSTFSYKLLHISRTSICYNFTMNGEEMRREKVKNLHQQTHMAMPQNSWAVLHLKPTPSIVELCV